MQENKVDFIIYSESTKYLQECIFYIKRLKLPDKYRIGILSMTSAGSLPEAYQEGMKASDAKYKVYISDHTFMIDDMFLYHLVKIFRNYPNVGMFGIRGQNSAEEYGREITGTEYGIQEINLQGQKGNHQVSFLEEALVATQYDIDWDIEDKKKYMHIQCRQFIYQGYQVIVPYQERCWCLNDREKSRGEMYDNIKFLIRRIEVFHDLEAAEKLKAMLTDGEISIETCEKLVNHICYAKGMVKWFIMDLVSGTRKTGKYVDASGSIAIDGRTECGMHIITAFNDNWSSYAGVMLQSLYENNRDIQITVHVLQADVKEGHRMVLRKQAAGFEHQIIFYDFDIQKLPSDIMTNASWTEEAYFRLFIADMLPEYIERGLYLDPDIIINRCIYDLYFMDMGEREVIGCREFSRKKEGFGDIRDELFASCIVEEDFEYFNSGVMLLNIKKIREHVKGSDYFRLLPEEQKAFDQDLLNLMHWKQAAFVDEFRYNFFPRTCFGAVNGLTENEIKQFAAIVHYGGPKPWNTSAPVRADRLWWEWAARTEWKVSVIIPTYNRRDTLGRAIDSVLNQTYKEFEIIIVDDCSSDGTYEYISKRYGDDNRIVYIKNDSNIGQSASRNTGAAYADGYFVAFLDDDDEWLPDKLEKQIRTLWESGKDVGFVYSSFIFSWDNGMISQWPPVEQDIECKRGDVLKTLLLYPLVGMITVVIKKDLFVELGGFNEELLALEDYEFSIRAARVSPFAFVDEALAIAHVSKTSVGKNKDNEIMAQCFLINKYKEELEKHGIREAKFQKVFRNAMGYGNVKKMLECLMAYGDDIEYYIALAKETVENQKEEYE